MLSQVRPGRDGFITELYATEIEVILGRWSSSLCQSQPNPDALAPDFANPMAVFWPVASRQSSLRRDLELEIFERSFQPARLARPEVFLRAWKDDLATLGQLLVAEFMLEGIQVTEANPLRVETHVLYALVGSKEGGREQRLGRWTFRWRKFPVTGWKVERWTAGSETVSRSPRPLFRDITLEAFGGNASFRQQMLPGTDFWRSRLDAACGIDVYGNNGLAVGDFDGDGYDDLYVCEPAGLPNRLYRNRGDGTFEDVTDQAGVGVLDNTACALFADFLNRGRQDLLVVRAGGPLLFLNQGDGRFELKADAFKFARAPQGTFTGAAAADYERDGRLDLYCCIYNYYLGLSQYNYPVPYYDAENGPPNFLFHNEGDGTFADWTAAAGLNQNNHRYSFTCGWCDEDNDGWPDLYVVNDFGRKNLYHNNGNGTFSDVAQAAGVEDYGAGMSVCWMDFDNDGRMDLYVADMWTAAGRRVTAQDVFQPRATPRVRAFFRKHASGNSLFRNLGNHHFADVTASAGVGIGRWAWCSDSWDFDQDGYPDLYVVNGFISGPHKQELASFFWRQVVAQSPLNALPSPGYEKGWNAINELIRSDGTWDGYQRNVFYVNNRRGGFMDVSGVVGLDFIQDCRSFALADFDHDGRLEVVLKSRNSPRLRMLRNSMQHPGAALAISLRGRKSNRDAIGATVSIESPQGVQSRVLQAGGGFLTQHTKQLFFGLGNAQKAVRATVRWPNGQEQAFENLPLNSRVEIEEGQATFRVVPFGTASLGPGSVSFPLPVRDDSEHSQTWLIEPLQAPDFALPDLNGRVQKLESFRGRPLLLNFGALDCSQSREQLRRFEADLTRFSEQGVALLAILVPEPSEGMKIRSRANLRSMRFPILLGNADVVAIYDLLYRYLFDRHRNLITPTSFLIDPQGWIIRVYRGRVNPRSVLSDWASAPRTTAERIRRALPFAGTYYGGPLQRNQFTYGVAFFERGYSDQAITSFRQAIQADPTNPDAFYNLGTLYLRKHMLAEARQALQTAVRLKPIYPNAWNNLGMIAAETGNIQEAIANLERAIQQDPSDAIALENLGNLYDQLGRKAEAEAELQRAVSVAPNDPQASYTLGMFYAKHEDLPKAERFLQKAIVLQPDFPSALNNLGVVLLRSGHPSAAERTLQQCLRTAPDFEQAYLNLARLYVMQGRRRAALRLLREFLGRHPSNALAKRALEQLTR